MVTSDTGCARFVVTGEDTLIPDHVFWTRHLLWSKRCALDILRAVSRVLEELLASGAIHTGERRGRCGTGSDRSCARRWFLSRGGCWRNTVASDVFRQITRLLVLVPVQTRGTVILDWYIFFTVVIGGAVMSGIEAVAVADWWLGDNTFWVHGSKDTRLELRVKHKSF